MFLTLTQIKKHLNLESTFTEDDEYLTLLAESAEAMVQKHIDNSFEALLVKGKLPKPLYNAMLLFIGNLYANRESISPVEMKEIPVSYQYLLDAYKNWLGAENVDEPTPMCYYGYGHTYLSAIPSTEDEIKAGSKLYATATLDFSKYPFADTLTFWCAYKTEDTNIVNVVMNPNTATHTNIVGDYTVFWASKNTKYDGVTISINE